MTLSAMKASKPTLRKTLITNKRLAPKQAMDSQASVIFVDSLLKHPQKQPALCINRPREQRISSCTPMNKKHLMFWTQDSPPFRFRVSRACEKLSYCILTLDSRQWVQFPVNFNMFQSAFLGLLLFLSAMFRGDSSKQNVNFWLSCLLQDIWSEFYYEECSKVTLITEVCSVLITSETRRV